ncbi:DUF4184 family protein [Streptomyces sp. NPDC050264]|uniref:DUF4184 family protein n=1 Tax=Streptomyces sp. NPDC050264 TaxID=3155038 RepID=UPI00342E763D
MPFTISHAAAVLPFLRRDGAGRGRLVPSLLVAGSFAPDVTYFLASAVPGAMEFGDFTHSFTGVFTVDILIALALVALWRLIREPVLALLPRRVRGRVWTVARGQDGGGDRWRPWWWYVSAALGATTHVVWDAFTHPDRWGMRVFPVLGEEVAGSPLYWYVQYGSSAIALIVIGVFAWRAVRGAPGTGGPAAASAGQRWAACALIGGCACGCAAVRVARWLAYVDESGLAWKPWEIVPTLCFGAGAGLALGLILYAVAARARPRHPERPTGPIEAEVRDRTAEPSRPSAR